MPAIATSVQHSIGSPTQSNYATKGNKVKVKLTQSCPTLWDPSTIQSMEFSRLAH